MIINVTVSNEELSEMGLNSEELEREIIDRLDDCNRNDLVGCNILVVVLSSKRIKEGEGDE